MRAGYLVIALGFITRISLGQTSPAAHPRVPAGADTSRVLSLLAEGRRCLFKPGEEKADLDSALRFTAEAATISQSLHFTRGIQSAALLTGNIDIEAKQYPEAWKVFPVLDDTSRLALLANMVRYRMYTRGNTQADFDSAKQVAALLNTLYPNPSDPRLITDVSECKALYAEVSGDTAGAAEIWTRGFEAIRRHKNIKAEDHYAGRMTSNTRMYSALIPTTLSLLTQLAGDYQQLLLNAPDEDRKQAVDWMTWHGVQLYAAGQSPAAITVESMAVRLNQLLRQHIPNPGYVLSFLYTQRGDTKAGLAAALEALRAAETPNGPVSGVGYEAAAKMCYVMGDYDKSLEYFYRSIPIYQKDPHLFLDPGSHFYRSIQILLKQHKPVDALSLLHVIRHRQRYSEMYPVQQRYYQLSTGNYFQALGRNDSAEYYYLDALKNTDPGLGPTRTTVHYNLAIFYTDTRQYARAKPFLDTLTSDANRKFNSFITMETAWQLRYRADSALHDYPRAMADLRSYQIIHDSLTNVTKNSQMAEMNVQYETEKRNQHITDLEKQNALQTSLQQATVRQARIVRNSLMAGAALFALLAAVIYNRYRIRRRMTSRLEKLTTRQQKLIKEKEWLLREIHHRVKNNLQIILSLLRMQSYQLKDETAISAFSEIGARVNTISLVHKKLYQEGENMAFIEMRDYIRDLTGYLREGFALGRRIAFRLEIEPITLDVAQCVPIGLILNEAITNAIKYAFPQPGADTAPTIDDATPTISVSLYEANGSLILNIADNGVGLPPGIDPEHTGSLGLQLIQTLTAQLEGTLVMTNNPGLNIVITFLRHTGALELPDLHSQETAATPIS